MIHACMNRTLHGDNYIHAFWLELVAGVPQPSWSTVSYKSWKAWVGDTSIQLNSFVIDEKLLNFWKGRNPPFGGGDAHTHIWVADEEVDRWISSHLNSFCVPTLYWMRNKPSFILYEKSNRHDLVLNKPTNRLNYKYPFCCLVTK